MCSGRSSVARDVGRFQARIEPSPGAIPSHKASERDNRLRGTDGTRACGPTGSQARSPFGHLGPRQRGAYGLQRGMRRPRCMTELREQAISVANRHIIERPRLTRLLDETTARVIMLVAPAGYGKTVLAQQWLKDRPHAFYRATESADPGAIGLGLLHAGTSVAETVGDRFEQWLRSRRGTEASEVAAHLLAEDLRVWPDGAWLAI